MEFTELLSLNGVPYRTAHQHHHAREGWVQIDCPWCGPGTGKFHLGYSLAFGSMNCWKCGPQNPLDVLLQITNLNKREAIAWLKERRPGNFTPSETPKGTYQPPAGVGDLRKAHREYLKSRGFKPSEIERLWLVQGIGISSRLPWRIFIPIHQNGVPVSWTTRAIGKQGLRYVTASPTEELVSSKKLLYGLDYVRNAMIVHEGPLDVWATGPGAVCTFGTNYTTAQIRLMAECPLRALCFDSEPTAQRRARDLADRLSVLPGETLLIELDAEDAASATPRERRKLRETVFGRAG